MEYRASASIDASPEEVWDVLVDTERWPLWNPNCLRVEGRVAVGEQLIPHTKLSPRVFPVRITLLDPPRRMVWTGGLPLGLFKGVRTFEISPEGAGCTFTLKASFSGPLFGPLMGQIPDMGDAFIAFVEGLKQYVEEHRHSQN